MPRTMHRRAKAHALECEKKLVHQPRPATTTNACRGACTSMPRHGPRHAAAWCDACWLDGSSRRLSRIGSTGTTQGTTKAIRELLSNLITVFDQSPARGRKRKAVNATKSARGLHPSCQKIEQLTTELGLESSARICHRIQRIWLVKICLSKPTVPSRTLASFLQDYPARDTQQVSHVRIGQVLDTCVELVKEWNCDEITNVATQALQADESVQRNAGRVLVKHIHDESSMRVKSRGAGELDEEFWKGQYSKVQNQYVRVYVGDRQPIEFYAELEALAKKDRPSIATSIIKAMECLLACVAWCRRPGGSGAIELRLVRWLIGDGVNTNENCAKRVLQYFTQAKIEGVVLKYSLLVVKCASHQANLVILVNIVGDVVAKPHLNDRLCATRSRSFE